MDNCRTLKYVLDTVGVAALKPKGSSMYPYLRPEYTLVIRKLTEKPKKYQCVAFRKSETEYILHRVIEVGEDYFVPCGDNNLKSDGKIPYSLAIGYLEGFYKGRKYKKDKVNIFTKIGCLYPVRFMRIYFFRALKKIKKLFKKNSVSAI